MLSMQRAIDEVRFLVGTPAPVSNGADLLSDERILKWLNEGYAKLVDMMMGAPVYLEFTYTPGAPPTIEVTKSTSDPIVEDTDITSIVEEFTWYKFPSVRSLGVFKNLTSGFASINYGVMELVDSHDPGSPYVVQDAQTYFLAYGIDKTKGMVLLPQDVTQVNTVGIHYRQKFQRLHIAALQSPVVFTGTGLEDMTESGTFTGLVDTLFEITISDAASSPNKFQYIYSLDNGENWSGVVELPCSTTGTTLIWGIVVTFGALTGHTLGDQWDFTAYPDDTPPSYFDDEDEKYPIAYAGRMCCIGLEDTKITLFENDMNLALSEFMRRRISLNSGPSLSIDKPMRRLVTAGTVAW